MYFLNTLAIGIHLNNTPCSTKATSQCLYNDDRTELNVSYLHLLIAKYFPSYDISRKTSLSFSGSCQMYFELYNIPLLLPVMSPWALKGKCLS